MKISAKNLTKELQKLWPDLIDVWPMDIKFMCPTKDELEAALSDIKDYRVITKQSLEDRGIIMNSGFKHGVHDCDNFALELQADVSRYRLTTLQSGVLEPGLLPWAFGTAICMRVKGLNVNHTVNICKTSDRSYVFIEPQDLTIWLADKEQDTPYFVEMR